MIGGALGAGIWAGITYFTQMEIGWIAWGVGFLVGAAVRVACSTEEGIVPGGIAVIGAVLALLIGKYAAIVLLLNAEADFTSTFTAMDRQVQIADEIVEEWEAEGRKLRWPNGMGVEIASGPSDYPPKVWEETQKRWSEFTPEEQESQIAERQAEFDELAGDLKGAIAVEAFKESFNAMDLLFFGLAIFTAFKLGSGFTTD